MILANKSIYLMSVAALALTACTAPEGSPRTNTNQGALIGGAIGAMIGAASGDRTLRRAAAGAAIGAAAGALIGQQLDLQEEALRAQMGNGQVGIVNTGSELIVTLPEAITFDTGSDFVRDSLFSDLLILAENMNEFPNTTIDVIGHTDNVGAATFNQELSARRADAVADILLSNDVAENRVRAFGRGEDEPKASNLSESGRAENRRVEIVIRPVQ